MREPQASPSWRARYTGPMQHRIPRRQLLFTAVSFAAAPAAAGEALAEPSLHLPPQDGPARVALTLDACGGGFDERIAAILVQHAIPATIFATAIWIHRNPAALSVLMLHHDLFRLEDHGARHVPAVLGTGTVYGLPVAGTPDAVREEVAGGATAITAAGAPAPAWFRGATARYSPAAIELIRGMGYGIAGYSLNADQGASLPASVVAARVSRARPSDVILGHINQPHRPSGAGIAEGILALKAQGMGFAWLPRPAVG